MSKPAAPPPLDLDRTALFLDYDGTLVEIAPTPDAALADPELIELLTALERRAGGALALISGRPVASLDGFLAPLRLVTAGLHGLDLRTADGRRLMSEVPHAELDRVRDAFAAFVRGRPGTMVEDKERSVVLHFRQAPAAEADAVALGERLARESGSTLRLLHGKMVVELLPAGVDKGRAIAALVDLPPFRGRVPVYVGDDVTDEAGFRVVNDRGGTSVKVGLEGATEARFRLAGNRELREWLRAALRAANAGADGTRRRRPEPEGVNGSAPEPRTDRR